MAHTGPVQHPSGKLIGPIQHPSGKSIVRDYPAIVVTVGLRKSCPQAVAIVGEVGSGKSTLLAAIIGEIPAMTPRRPSVAFDTIVAPPNANAPAAAEPSRLPVLEPRFFHPLSCHGSYASGEARPGVPSLVRVDRVCYAAQNPWVMSGTVRDNVLFGLPFDEELYR